MIHDLTTGNLPRKLILFSLPIMLANFLQTLYNIVDMAFVGRFAGHAALTAVSIGSDVVQFPFFIAIGLSLSCQTIVAQYVGRKNTDALNRAIGTMFSLGIIIALILTVIGIVFVHPILNMLNTQPETFPFARSYLIINFIGLFAMFGYNIAGGILRGMGDSKRPLLFITIACCTNIVLDFVFVVLLDMKATGSAIATILGQIAAFVFSMIYLYRKRESFFFDFKAGSFVPYGPSARMLLKLGIPSSIQLATVAISIIFISSYINSFGLTITAITGIGNKLTGVINTVTASLNAASAATIGQNLGAGKIDRCKRTILVSLIVGLAVCTVLCLLLILYAVPIFRLFDQDPAVLALVPRYIPIAVITFYGYAIRAPLLGLVGGLGFPQLGMSIAITECILPRGILAVVMGITLGMGYYGFWLASAVGGYTTIFFVVPYLISGKWKTRKLIIG